MKTDELFGYSWRLRATDCCEGNLVGSQPRSGSERLLIERCEREETRFADCAVCVKDLRREIQNGEGTVLAKIK